MKVAFCFSGQIRNIDDCIKYWKPIIESYNGDVYGSFWETEEEEKNKFITGFSPNKIEFEDYSIFEKTTVNIFKEEINPPVSVGPIGLTVESGESVKKSNMLPMFYKIWRSNLLSNKEEYDVVVRLRTDVFLSDFKIELNEYLNIPHGSVGIWNWEGCFGPIDLIAYGNQKLMNYYSTAYLYLTRFLKDGEYFIPVENLLRVHLSQKDITIRNFISCVYLFRNLHSLKEGDPHIGSQNPNNVNAEEKIFSSKKWFRDPKEINPLLNFRKPFD
jgi:hypothetical protein